MIRVFRGVLEQSCGPVHERLGAGLVSHRYQEAGWDAHHPGMHWFSTDCVRGPILCQDKGHNWCYPPPGKSQCCRNPGSPFICSVKQLLVCQSIQPLAEVNPWREERQIPIGTCVEGGEYPT